MGATGAVTRVTRAPLTPHPGSGDHDLSTKDTPTG